MADAQIGKADYALGADQTQLVKDLSSAEQKINASGQHMQASGITTGTAFKAGAAVAAGGFALMTKGALDMEAAQGQYQAATGASADVSKQFAQDMNGLVGNANTVKDSFQQITAAGTEVATQFQIQGTAATDLTNQILGYAKVTGSDGVTATDSLHGALAAFNLDASQGANVMDLLVASHQKFGTQAGPASLDALQKMAPALQAMNLGVGDGVGLLNLFQTAGLDSSKSAIALQTAVKNLKPGQTLNDLITQIGSIQDPTDRAQAAMKIFGTRAGAGLADAIKPGMTSLADFTISADDAKGATDNASESMDTTEEKIQMWAQKAGAALRGFGADFGPVLTGSASLISIMGALGPKVTGPIVSAFKSVGGLAVDALKGAVGMIVGQATIVGAAEGEAETEGAAGPSMLARFLAKFGLMTGPKVAAAAAAGEAEGAAEGTAAATAMGGEEAVGAAGTAGAAVGGSFIAAIAPVLAIGAVGLGVMFLPQILTQLTGQDANDQLTGAAKQAADVYATGYSDEVKATYAQKWKDAYNASLNAAGPFLSQANYDAASKAATAAADGFITTLPDDVKTAASGSGFMQGFANSVGWQSLGQSGAESMGLAFGSALQADSSWDSSGAYAAKQVATGFGVEVLLSLPGQIHQILEYVNAPFVALGATIPSAIGQGIVDNGKDLLTAGDNLIKLLATGLTPMQEAAKLEGKKYTDAVAEGVTSEIPGAKQSAQEMAIQTIQTIEQASNGTPDSKGLVVIGQMYADLLKSGITSQQAAVALAAGGVSAAVVQTLTGYQPLYDKQGKVYDAMLATGVTSNAGAVSAAVTTATDPLRHQPVEAWATGLGSTYIAALAKQLGSGSSDAAIQGAINHVLKSNLSGNSPPPRGPLHTIDKDGEMLADTYLGGFTKGLDSFTMPDLALPGLALPSSGGATSAGATFTMGDVNITVTGVAGDPTQTGDVVGAKVRAVLDDFISSAMQGTSLSWNNNQ